MCLFCSNPLDGMHPSAKICRNPECVRERNRIKAAKHGKAHLWGKTRVCPLCKRQFTVNRGRHKYCSPPCALEAPKAKRLEARNSH